MVFKTYVDKHVRSTTKFKSAEELLKNSKPTIFVWICFGIGALISLLAVSGMDMNAQPGYEGSEAFVKFLLWVAFTVFFGMVPAWITGIVLKIKLNHRMKAQRSRPAADINPHELVAFLNANLQYLSPYLVNWKYIAGGDKHDDAVTCKFTKKTNIVITFGTNYEGQRFYQISARKASVIKYVVLSGSGLGAGNTNAGFGEYSCLYKSTPILTAAMEYYLKGLGDKA